MMDRSREARRVNMAASNGLSRRRHRSGSTSQRDSPEDDGPAELNEAAGGRLRDRAVVVGKKDRDRERERERDRDRDRERDRMSMMMMSGGSVRSKRRRGERLIVHHNNHHTGAGHNFAADDSSEESLNEDEEEDDDDHGGSVRMLPPNNSTQNHSTAVFTSTSSSAPFPNHHHHQQNHHGFIHHRKSFPPQPQPFHPPTAASGPAPAGSKIFRSSPTSMMAASSASAPPWASDEVIGVSVPRKARSASTKRPQESWASSGGGSLAGSDPIHRQASTSPARSSGPGAPGLAASASASPAPAPVSPSSSNVSAKKKLKTNGQKLRPPKSSSSKSASSAQDEIEIEIAEVLYGMMRQPQVPTSAAKPETSLAGSDLLRLDFREVGNSKPAGDAKSRVSSPASNSPSASGVPAQPCSLPNQAISISAAGGPLVSATAPKRKRPRPVKYEEENPTVFPVRSSPIPMSTAKVDAEQPVKAETCSPNLEKTPESGTATQENGRVSFDLLAAAPSSSEPRPVLVEQQPALDSKVPLIKEPEARETVVGVKKEGLRSPNPGLKLDSDREAPKAAKSSPLVYEPETQRGEKFEIDLMAPPPVRSSPERDSEIDFVAVGPKPMVTNLQTDLKPHVVNKDDDKVAGKEDVTLERDEKKAKVMGEEVDSQKPSLLKERNIDLRLDLEKIERDSGSVSGNGTKLQQNVQKQRQQPPSSEKSAVGAPMSSLHLPMSMAGWPGALPHIGYMAPLQGVVSMEGNALPSAVMPPPHLLSSPQRPKRCATHCHIARNIHYHQQLSRMNPFWPAAAGTGLAPYGAKMNVLPSADLHTGRGVNPLQEKGQGTAAFPGPSVKDKNSPAGSVVDAAQRKQILVQQPLPPGGPSNILHGPAFIFPLSRQQAVAAASVRSGNVKTPPAAGGASSSSPSSSSTIAAAATAVAGATAMNFTYPNMAGSETPYLAILQNGAYPIPIPAHVGTNPAYRGAHPQAVPFFNGSFYPTQMLHPSHLQHQQQPPPAQSQQSQRGPQNPVVSSGSSSSQKQLLNQQQKSHATGINGSGPNLQGYSATKNQSSQSLQFQQRQQQPNPNAPHQVRQQEGEIGSEDSPSAAASRANTNIYGQNFMVPMHPPNFAFMNPAALSGASGLSGNPSEKKQQNAQQQSSRAGGDSLPSQSFAMSFASINGAATAQGFDISSIAQNPALLQSLPEAARHSIQFMAAANAQVQHHKQSYRASGEGKTGGNDSSNTEEDRKAMACGKVPANAGQSIAFARPDQTDASVSSMVGNHVIDSSARNLNLGSAPGRLSGSVMQPTVGNVNAPGVQQQLQRAQQQQMVQRAQQQQQFTVSTSASARSKNTATSNGSVYSDHVSSPSSVAAKFPNALSGFPQSIVQNIGSPVQSPQWKNSARTTISQVPSPSSLASNSSAPKNLPQQQNRAQQSHTQISFGANPKSTVAPQGQSNPSSNHSPSSPMVVGSPTTSISKSAGGSPRTTSTSTSNKGGQNPTPSQQVKNSGPMPAQKSSPVGGRNAPSILGHPNSGASTPSSAPKTHQLTQQQQQQLSKFAHSQMMYAGAFMQSQAPHVASSTNNTSSAFYLQNLQRHRNEQPLPPPQSQGPPITSSTGMLTLCPQVSTATDPAKAAASGNMKGGTSPYVQFAAAQSSGKPHQLVSAGFPYAHAVPAAVQVKQADQKQPAGD